MKRVDDVLTTASATVGRFEETVKTICHTIQQLVDFESNEGVLNLEQHRMMRTLTDNLKCKGVACVVEAVDALERFVRISTTGKSNEID